MNRRACLTALAAAGLTGCGASAAKANPIQLHLDMDVIPSREEEMLSNFEKSFRPVISRQPGFVEVKLLKLRELVVGDVPVSPYRMIISFETEEQRLTWVATDEHQEAWPTVEQTLQDAKFTAVLYDVV